MICYGCGGTIESGADVYRAPINATVGEAVFHADCWAEWNAEGESVITDRRSFVESNALDQNQARGLVIRRAIEYLKQFGEWSNMPPGTVELMAALLQVQPITEAERKEKR